MPNVSLLMLTYNDIQMATKTLDMTRNSVEEQIIIDSSDEKNKQLLEAYAKTNPKVKIYPILALGIPETCIPYGISKCTSDMILLLDADEEPCDEFLKFLKDSHFIAEVNYITRYESSEKSFATRQLRVFEKGKVEWIGVPHEHPKITGSKGVLDKNLYLVHQKSQMTREYRNDDHYRLMEKVGLFTNESRLRRIVAAGYITARMNPKKLFTNLKASINETRRTDEQKEISKTIGGKGIIKYLGLDKEGAIEALTEKYKGKAQGPQLLIDLIQEKYRSDKA
jgi:hypothetical protein